MVKAINSLTSVTIGNSVTSIKGWAFAGCSSLENIYYNGDINSWVQIDIDGLYSLMRYGKSSKNLYINGELLTEANITTATKINGYAFYSVASTTSVTIGNSVTSIEAFAFAHCSSLESVTISNSVTSIGDEAFYYCGSLTSVTIGNGVKNIGILAFSGCSNLTSVVFKDTSNWYIYVNTGSYYKAKKIDVSDARQNAEILKTASFDLYGEMYKT